MFEIPKSKRSYKDVPRQYPLALFEIQAVHQEVSDMITALPPHIRPNMFNEAENTINAPDIDDETWTNLLVALEATFSAYLVSTGNDVRRALEGLQDDELLGIGSRFYQLLRALKYLLENCTPPEYPKILLPIAFGQRLLFLLDKSSLPVVTATALDLSKF